MSYTFNLNNRESTELKKLLRETESSKILKRYQCIHFKEQGLKNKDIALLLCVNIDTVTDWIRIFLEKGLRGLGGLQYAGRRPPQLDLYKEEIKAHVSSNIVPSIKELQGYILNTYKLPVEHSWLFRYCKKNSIALTKRPKAILVK